MPMERLAQPMSDADVARMWDANAPQWVRQVRAGWDRYRETFNNPMFFAFLPDLAGRQIIDLGCGEGRTTRELARRGARMTGIDVSPRMIEAACAAEVADPLGIQYRTGSFSGLDGIPDGAFDLAVSTMALMDGPNFAGAAQAAFRVLRPGGALYFSVLHPCFVTPQQKWLQDETGEVTGFQVGDYYDEDVFLERWRFNAAPREDDGLFAVPRFPHRLETYVNGLCEAGFGILKMSEPRPTAEMAEADPRLARLRRHFPLFLYVAAERPINPVG